MSIVDPPLSHDSPWNPSPETGISPPPAPHRVAQRFKIWAAGLSTASRTMPREPILGIKRLLLPVSYWRAAEFAYAWDLLRLPPGSKILDLGSPRDLASILAFQRHHEVVGVDIMESEVRLRERYYRAQGVSGTGPGRIATEVQDGRALSYGDESFDAAYSISVLEHIPGSGDREAIREMLRVVRPGGLVVVTVPFDRAYRETYIQRSVYERKQESGAPVFYQRHYDWATLNDRLIAPGAELVGIELWGERLIPVESVLSRMGRGSTLLAPLEPLLSLAFLRRVEEGSSARPMAAFFALRKKAE